MSTYRCPTCDIPMDPGRVLERDAWLCASCGGTFLPGTMRPLVNPWRRWNTLAHLAALTVVAVLASGTLLSSFIDEFALGLQGPAASVVLGLAVGYALVTTAVVVAARRQPWAAPVLHLSVALIAAGVTWGPAGAAEVRGRWREWTRPAPVTVPRVLTLTGWHVPDANAATVELAVEAPGGVELEELAWSGASPPVSAVPAASRPRLRKGATAFTVPLRQAAPAPEHSVLTFLVYPAVREATCANSPGADAPTDRVIFRQGLTQPRHLGPTPHRCGAVDTWEYPLPDALDW